MGNITFIILTIIAVILGINLISFILKKLLSRNELDGIKPLGKLVKVNGRKMHVHSMGNGEKTIVLLPGLGIPLPSVDFAPLMRELSKKYTVVCVEFFGYGFSDQTDTPRTNKNYTEEIRQALAGAGFKPPYILMPYSASGIYCEYYATKYPQEVEGLILLDTTSSAEKEASIPGFVIKITKFQRAIGIMRFLNPLILPKATGITKNNGYSEQEIKEILKFANHAGNDTIDNQLMEHHATILEVMDMEFPKEVPVLMLSADGYKKGKWEKYRANHLKKLGEHAKYKVIEGSNHSNIYHDMSYRKVVCETVSDFVEKEGKKTT